MAKNPGRAPLQTMGAHVPPVGSQIGGLIRTKQHTALKAEARADIVTTSGLIAFKDPALAGYGDDYFNGWWVIYRANNVNVNGSNLTVGEMSQIQDYTDDGTIKFTGASYDFTAAISQGDEFILLPPEQKNEVWNHGDLAITMDGSTTGALSTLTGALYSAGHKILTVVGKCRIKLWAECTTNLTGTGNIALGLESRTTSPRDRSGYLIASTVGTLLHGTNLKPEIWKSAVDAAIDGFALSSACIFDFITTGLDVGYTINTATLTAGVLVFHFDWQALTAGSYCAAATGAAASLTLEN